MNDHPTRQLQSPLGSSYLVAGLGTLFLTVPLIYFGSIRGATEPKDFLAEIILFSLMAVWIIQKQPLPKQLSRQDQIVGLFFLFYLGSSILAENYYWSLWGLNKWAALLILYLLAQQIDHNQQDKLIAVLLTAGSLVGGFAIFNYYGLHFDAVIQTLSCRGAMISTFGNQNYLSAFLAPLIPLNIYLILNKPDEKRFLPYASFTLILSTLLYAKTRGALLGVLASVIVLAILAIIYQRREWLKARYRQLAILAGITLILLTLFGGTPPFSNSCDESLTKRFGQDMMFEAGSTQTRLMLWGLTADMIKDHPLKGIGIGNYGFAMPSYQKDFLTRPANWHFRSGAGWALDAHNQYLQIAAEGGLITAGLFLGLLIYLAFRFFQVAHRSRDNFQMICLLCSLAAISIHALVSFPLSLMSSSLLFWFLAGRANLALHPNIVPQRMDLPCAWSDSLRYALLLLLAVMASATLLKFTSDRYLAVGNRLEIKNEFAAAEKYYRTSVSLNPPGWRNNERLGAVLSKQGRYLEAIQHFGLARRNALTDLIDNEEGLNFVRQGQYAPALQAFERGRSFFPRDFNLNQNSGLAAKALADPLFYGGDPLRAVELSKLALLYLEQALPLAVKEQDSLKIGYYLISLSSNLLNQPERIRATELKSAAIFSPDTEPRRHIIEETVSGTRTRVRLFCSSPQRAEAQIPPDAEEILSIRLGEARLYQYRRKN